MENIFILLLALAIDVTIGEYPSFFHPVIWMGKVISWQLKLAPNNNAPMQFIYGMFMVIFTIILFSLPVYLGLSFIRSFSTIAYIILSAILLKSSFSFRELLHASKKVQDVLNQGDIGEGRKEISHLVSRNTQNLDSQGITSAVVEMASESVTDSFVSPLFYWLLLSVPGAIAYRVANTFDSMIGYHGKYEYLGKFAALLDDVLNYIPARISGLFLVISAYLIRVNRRQAWLIMLRDHSKTESPNAGWTMSAMAGALGVQLEKSGYYRLGDNEKPLLLSSISVALKLVALSLILWFGTCIVIAGIRYAIKT